MENTVPADLDAVFAALADPVRRAILQQFQIQKSRKNWQQD
jgi:hypothetical protein